MDVSWHERHPLRFRGRPGARALVVCADGEGVDGWAEAAERAGLPLAFAGFESAGLQARDMASYDRHADPRACAYLPDVDQAYFDAHLTYVLETVRPLEPSLPRLVFGVSNGAAWAAHAAVRHPELFAGVGAFSLGVAPWRPARVPHALVAGTLEEGFHRQTRRYAWKLRLLHVPVRFVTPERGHDYEMWLYEFCPAFEWLLDVALPRG